MTDPFEEAVRRAARELGSAVDPAPSYHQAWERGRRRRAMKRTGLAAAAIIVVIAAIGINLGRTPGSTSREVDEVAVDTAPAVAEPTVVATTSPLDPSLQQQPETNRETTPPVAASSVAPTATPSVETPQPTSTATAEPTDAPQPSTPLPTTIAPDPTPALGGSSPTPAPTVSQGAVPSSPTAPTVTPESTPTPITSGSAPPEHDAVSSSEGPEAQDLPSPEPVPPDDDDEAATAAATDPAPSTALVPTEPRRVDATVLVDGAGDADGGCDTTGDGQPDAVCELLPDYACSDSADPEPGYVALDTDEDGVIDLCRAGGVTFCDTTDNGRGDTPCIITLDPSTE